MTTDDELIDRLRLVAATVDAVPETVEANARAAFASRLIGYELAELLADSATATAGAVRSDDPRLRLLSFHTPTVSVELQVEYGVGRMSLRGQVTGVCRDVELEMTTGRHPVSVDGDGWFAVDDIPAGTVRLRLRADDGTPVTTSWLSL